MIVIVYVHVGGSGSENERTVSSDVEQSDLSADDSDLSDLESLILRRRRATKRDTTVAFSPLKDGSKRFRMRGTSTESRKSNLYGHCFCQSVCVGGGGGITTINHPQTLLA